MMPCSKTRCFVSVQNNTTLKLFQLDKQQFHSFVSVQNNTTLKPTGAG